MDFSLLTIEILTALLGLALLVLGLLLPKEGLRGLSYFATLGLVGILVTTFFLRNTQGEFLGGMYLADSFGFFFKQLFLSAAILVSLASHEYVKKLGYNQGEFYSLLVFATLGMMVMTSAGELVALYLGLELMTITFCILACFRHGDAKSSEAGIKYLILGALSSAILLYGLSLIYGLASGTSFGDIAAVLKTDRDNPLLLLGVVFMLAGFAFKISAVPFHMWAPDIYEGAPTPVTAFMAVASKAAGFAVLVRIFLTVLPGELQEFWGVLVVVLTLLTVVIGNLIAIPQTNIKRLLAYSSIAQAGYILLGVVAYSSLGVMAILFHSMLYVFANLGAFMVATAFYNVTGSDEIEDYNGLARRSPLMAAVMLFSLLSLAGIPPLSGFVSKFFLFTAVIEQGYVWLAIISVLMSMVSVYYYLMVVKAMYLKPPGEGMGAIAVPAGLQLALVVAVVVSFFFGIYPTPLSDVALNVAHSFFP